MPGLYGCCMHMGRVYTEVALLLSFMHAIALIDVTIGEIGAFDEVHEWSLSLLLPSMRQMVCVFSLSSLWLWHQTQEFTERYFT